MPLTRNKTVSTICKKQCVVKTVSSEILSIHES